MYRGAILKRLGRLDEVEADLQLATKYASNSYEIDDISYNFACVFAMRGDRKQMMKMIHSIGGNPRYLSAVRAHLEDYFSAYRLDGEFLQAIGALATLPSPGAKPRWSVPHEPPNEGHKTQ
jgi:hypothetical protein